MTLEIPISKLDYGVNVRNEKDEDIMELADSIEAHDILQPLVVRPSASRRYEVVCGHRRLKALKKVGGDIRVPCIVRDDIKDSDILQIQLEENIQRKQMSAIELVDAFNRLKAQNKGLTNKEIAKMLNKSPQWIENQYTAINRAKELYGDEETIRHKNLSAGQIIGAYQKKKREKTKIAKNGFTVEHLGKIITVKCDNADVVNRVLSELKKI